MHGRGVCVRVKLAYLSCFLAESPQQQHNHMDRGSAHLNIIVGLSYSNQAGCHLGG